MWAEGTCSVRGSGGDFSFSCGVDRDDALRHADLDRREADAEALPFPDGRFEFLSMGYALRHVADLRSTFQEYHRVLAPGGRLLILEITPPRSRRLPGGARPASRNSVWMYS